MSERNYGYNGDDYLVTMYLRDASVYNLLTPEQEKEISAKSLAGCEESRKIMIESNLRLVVSIAKEFSGISGMSFIDLVNEGNIGLMKSLEKYDPRHEPYAKFSTYAVWGIKQHIRTSILNKGNMIRIPINKIEKRNKINRVSSVLSYELGRRPSIGEISERTGLGQASIRRTRKYHNSRIVSIDSPISDNNPITYMDILSSNIEGVDVKISRFEDYEQLSKALTHLAAKDLDILQRRFGLREVPVETLDQIGHHYGVTRERIRQIESEAIKKLRSKFSKLNW